MIKTYKMLTYEHLKIVKSASFCLKNLKGTNLNKYFNFVKKHFCWICPHVSYKEVLVLFLDIWQWQGLALKACQHWSEPKMVENFGDKHSTELPVASKVKCLGSHPNFPKCINYRWSILKYCYLFQRSKKCT